MICNHCSERSGAPSTTDIEDEPIPKEIGKMLGFTRISGGEVNEKDLQAVVKKYKSPPLKL